MNFDSIHLSHLPGIARLFVGIVTTLMMLVVLWAVWISTIEKGGINRENLPDYLSEQQKQDLREDTPLDRKYSNEEQSHSNLRHNLGLAHVHINGQTLLFFSLGLIFLFTSASIKIKKLLFITFSAAIVVHVIGLSGEGFHWIFDELLAVSGVVILVAMLYMAFRIYVDLGHQSKL